MTYSRSYRSVDCWLGHIPIDHAYPTDYQRGNVYGSHRLCQIKFPVHKIQTRANALWAHDCTAQSTMNTADLRTDQSGPVRSCINVHILQIRRMICVTFPTLAIWSARRVMYWAIYSTALPGTTLSVYLHQHLGLGRGSFSQHNQCVRVYWLRHMPRVHTGFAQ